MMEPEVILMICLVAVLLAAAVFFKENHGK